MDYEQRYNDALARANEQLNGAKVFDYDNEQIAHDIRNTVYNIFPELAESDDERIRKAIYNALKYLETEQSWDFLDDNVDILDAYDWLEKQGKQKPQGKSSLEARQEMVDNTNKIEPKFKVGDFIVNDYCRGKVVELTNDAYLLDTGQGMPFSYEHNIHLWTIEDAKDGDVLVASDGSIFIYKNQRDNGTVHYIAVTPYNDLEINENDYSWERKDVCHPATKDEQTILFERMKEAGYELDANKKELINKLENRL